MTVIIITSIVLAILLFLYTKAYTLWPWFQIVFVLSCWAFIFYVLLHNEGLILTS